MTKNASALPRSICFKIRSPLVATRQLAFNEGLEIINHPDRAYLTVLSTYSESCMKSRLPIERQLNDLLIYPTYTLHTVITLLSVHCHNTTFTTLSYPTTTSPASNDSSTLSDYDTKILLHKYHTKVQLYLSYS